VCSFGGSLASSVHGKFSSVEPDKLILSLKTVWNLLMKVGDLVLPKEEHKTKGVDYGIGVIISMYEEEFDGKEWCAVHWKHSVQYWEPHEMELVSESR